MDLNNKFFRVHAITTDRYGIDPLKDTIVPKIVAIVNYTIHEVSQDERGAPDLIAKRKYGDEAFWWHIMAYNGICRYNDIIEGLTLRIPNFADIIDITNTAVNSQSKTNNVVTI